MSQKSGNEANRKQKASRRPKWLVMIYLAGDNNLSANSLAILQELEAAAPPSGEVRVVACFDPNTPRPRGARYLEINHRRHIAHPKPPMDWGLHNDLVPFGQLPGHPVTAPGFCEDPPSRPTASEPVAKEGLSRFLGYALKNHRAERYMLILFGHGSAVAGNTFLVDNNPPSFLRLKDFTEVLERHFDDDPKTDKPKLDILACDNCMMNGIETAYQLRKLVSYILGSQGLMLAVGWPFRKVIKQVVRDRHGDPSRVALGVLKACARNLIDFSLMDRSSEQALCDVTKLGEAKNIVAAVRRLSAAMQRGMEFGECGVLTPHGVAIRDAIKLARLEAQSYWAETFVDLYDFCELLLRECNKALDSPIQLFHDLKMLHRAAAEGDPGRERLDETAITPAKVLALLRQTTWMSLFKEIAAGCADVLWAIKGNKKKGINPFVLSSYYVGPELQYSNGVSIYFPWTLPESPIIFQPVYGGGSGRSGGGASGGSYGLSWASLDRASGQPKDYLMITAFEEYKGYDFAKPDAGDWAAFMECFFRATLRDVRRQEYAYSETPDGFKFFDEDSQREKVFVPPAAVDLQKSSSDTDSEDDCSCPTIKNYPRRFYLSPADCLRRCEPPPRPRPTPSGCTDQEPCASYLGWNIRGLVAQVIKLRGRGPGLTDGGEDRAEVEPEES